jgi:BirA family biotin operon repressor/biotin-[acetyl-CoA-carboxylase] ligase
MDWRVEHLAEVASTNEWLVERADEPEGLVVYADHQSAGRGRRDRRWTAPAGSALLCSVLVRAPAGDAQLVVAALALSARAALADLAGLAVTLKWPNDLLAGDAKIAGVLAQASGHGPTTTTVVAGLGVNLTAHPEGVGATDVREASGVVVAPVALLHATLDHLGARYGALARDEGRDALRHEYVAALATLGRRVRVERSRDVVEGVARDVDATGALVLDVDGARITVSAGDVVHLRGVASGTP